MKFIIVACLAKAKLEECSTGPYVLNFIQLGCHLSVQYIIIIILLCVNFTVYINYCFLATSKSLKNNKIVQMQ